MRTKQIVCLFFLILFNCFQCSCGAKSEPDYFQYLQQYGYTPALQSRLGSMVGDSQYKEGIRTFQRLYKLPQTGELDEKTKRFMKRPRCGNPDLSHVKSFGQAVDPEKLSSALPGQLRSKNQKAPLNIETQNVWPKKHLKWFIEEYPRQQKEFNSQEHIRRIINQSFYDWQQFSGLKFEMTNKKEGADFRIKFVSKDHDDDYPFDGAGATLAHAFYPKKGDIHFDDDEYFTDNYGNQNERYTLRLVASHEIGHALGLSHSYEEDSLMYPVYQQFGSNFLLLTDDKERIQAIYGEPQDTNTNTVSTKLTLPTLKPTSPTSTSFSNELPTNHWCPADFQAGCEGPDGELYLFKDRQVWIYRARTRRMWDSRPKSLNHVFPSISDMPVTTCVKSNTGYTYLFRRNEIWKVTNQLLVDGPKRVGAKNFPKNIRGTLVHNKSIYFLQGDSAYAFNEFKYSRALNIYNLRTILDPPPTETIHLGFTYGNKHYIFTRNHIFVYDSIFGDLMSDYPKPISNGWFACDTMSRYKSQERPDRVHDSHRDYSRSHDRDHHHHHRGKFGDHRDTQHPHSSREERHRNRHWND